MATTVKKATKATKKKISTAKKEAPETQKYSKTWQAALKSKGSVKVYDPSIM